MASFTREATTMLEDGTEVSSKGIQKGTSAEIITKIATADATTEAVPAEITAEGVLAVPVEGASETVI